MSFIVGEEQSLFEYVRFPHNPFNQDWLTPLASSFPEALNGHMLVCEKCSFLKVKLMNMHVNKGLFSFRSGRRGVV